MKLTGMSLGDLLTETGSHHAVGFMGTITSKPAALKELSLDVKLQTLLCNAVFFH